MSQATLQLLTASTAPETTVQAALRKIRSLCDKTVLSVDVETNGEDVRDGRGYITGIAVGYYEKGEAAATYFPFRHGAGENLPRELALELGRLFDAVGLLVFHNAKFDLRALRTIGIDYQGEFHDTMLMCHLLDENMPFAKTLESCAEYYLGPGNVKDMSPELQKWIDTFGWARVPSHLMRPYGEQDARLTLLLAAKVFPMFTDEGLLEYWKGKQRFLRTIMAMEDLGVRVDQELCERMVDVGNQRMAEIYKELGYLSPTSPKDLHELLIEQMSLPIVKRSQKTGKPSFDKFAMTEYEQILSRLNNTTAQQILEYRGWQKSVSSNYAAYVQLVSPDGRLRPNFKLHGTKTGRLSCEKPNLQQIPRSSDKPWNGQMKQAFVPERGFSLWEADYSQLELRLTAAYAKEESLIQVFDEGRDIFTEMSGRLGLNRQDTKTFVYSTQYGAGIRRIKNVFNISEHEAKSIRQNYFDSYPKIKNLSDMASNKARSQGKVRLWSSRYRHFHSPQEEAHKALNSVIQGGAADIVNNTMVRLYDEVVMPSNGECRMLLQVHDSVVFEIANGTSDKYLPKIKHIMEDVQPDFGVKFAVDVHKWGT